jgi:hypothetical protein
MGKKIVCLIVRNKKHKLSTEDISKVFHLTIKKFPHIPKFTVRVKHYEDETE